MKHGSWRIFVKSSSKSKKHLLYTYPIITATWTMTSGHIKSKIEHLLFGLHFPIMKNERKMEWNLWNFEPLLYRERVRFYGNSSQKSVKNLKHQLGHILRQSDGLKCVLYRAEQVAPTNTTVLILRETGTGKELIAAAIHNMSLR